MKKRILLIALALLLTRVDVLADNQIDFEANGFKQMKTTAYCMGTTTASGTPVRPGVVATDISHRGMKAIIYTTDGQFLGIYDCEDAGGTEAIKNGYVIDVYRANLTHCKSYMKLTQGIVYVKYIEGKG